MFVHLSMLMEKISSTEPVTTSATGTEAAHDSDTVVQAFQSGEELVFICGGEPRKLVQGVRMTPQGPVKYRFLLPLNKDNKGASPEHPRSCPC
jgi:hypothetical protein